MNKLKHYAQLIKLEHTLFALPFALGSVFLFAEDFPSTGKLFWILVALTSARTLGMALNRLIDEPYDRLNPRTKGWALVSGALTKGDVWKLILFSACLFLLSAFFINLLAFFLSPLVILLLWLYPYSKRFTNFPHLVLGIVYFLIPVAVDVALNSTVSMQAIVLGTAMAFWVAGFDVLYSLQDYEFDRKHGLKSVPVKFGVSGALKLARTFHLITFLSLLLLGFLHDSLGAVYFLGVFLLSLFLLYEHSLIKPNDISKINEAFFTVNGYVSVAFFITVLIERFL